MRYCQNCGKEVEDGVDYCPRCGVFVKGQFDSSSLVKDAKARKSNEGINKAIIILMDIVTIGYLVVSIIYALFIFFGTKNLGAALIVFLIMLIPLSWIVPMNVHIKNVINANETFGILFKICVLLFANTPAGILLLVRNEKCY